jgi:uncharacterized protein YndB with AHSA1/START domain
MSQTNTALLSNQRSAIHTDSVLSGPIPNLPLASFLHADQAMVRRWRVEGEGCKVHEFTFDFRIGGSEVSRFSFMDGPEIRLDAQFQDIVPDRRIVFSYRMAMGPAPFSASLTTVELVPSGDGTRLTYTEQGAFFDSVDSAQGREEGCRGLWKNSPRNFSVRSSDQGFRRQSENRF